MIKLKSQSVRDRLVRYAALKSYKYSDFEHKNFDRFVQSVNNFMYSVKVGNYCIIEVAVDGYIPPDPNDRISDWVPSKWSNVLVCKIFRYYKPEITSGFFKGIEFYDPEIGIITPEGKRLELIAVDDECNDDRDLSVRFMVSDEVLEELYNTCPAEVPREFFFKHIEQIRVTFNDEAYAKFMFRKWDEERKEEGVSYLESLWRREQILEAERLERIRENERKQKESDEKFDKLFK